jgi:hypothetical protein
VSVEALTDCVASRTPPITVANATSASIVNAANFLFMFYSPPLFDFSLFPLDIKRFFKIMPKSVPNSTIVLLGRIAGKRVTYLLLNQNNVITNLLKREAV